MDTLTAALRRNSVSGELAHLSLIPGQNATEAGLSHISALRIQGRFAFVKKAYFLQP